MDNLGKGTLSCWAGLFRWNGFLFFSFDNAKRFKKKFMFLSAVAASQGWLLQFANIAHSQDFASSHSSCDTPTSFFLWYVVHYWLKYKGQSSACKITFTMMLDRVRVATAVTELHPKSCKKQTDLWLTTAKEDISTLLYRIFMQKQFYWLAFPVLIIFITFTVMLRFVTKKEV